MRLPVLGHLSWSLHNGLIRVNAQGEVWALGARQTSVRYGILWTDAIRRAGLPAGKKRVLMLGLAGGGALSAVHSAHPQSDVVVVEYDPAMAAIASKLL